MELKSLSLHVVPIYFFINEVIFDENLDELELE